MLLRAPALGRAEARSRMCQVPARCFDSATRYSLSLIPERVRRTPPLVELRAHNSPPGEVS
jgi:hypothetical protein